MPLFCFGETTSELLSCAGLSGTNLEAVTKGNKAISVMNRTGDVMNGVYCSQKDTKFVPICISSSYQDIAFPVQNYV